MLGNVVGCLVRAELELCTSRAHAEVVQCVLFFLWHRAALWRRGWAAPGGAGDGLCAAAPCSITASRSKCRLPIMAEHVLSAVFVEGRRCLSVSQLLRSSRRAARRAPRPAAGCALLRNGRLAAAGRKWCRAGGGALQLMTVLVSGGPVCLPQPDQSAGCACSRRFAALCVCSHCLFMCLSLSQAALAVTLKCGPALVLLM